MKKLLCILLASIMLFVSFVGCSKNDAGENSTTPDSSANVTEDPLPPPVEDIDLVKNGEYLYTIIRADSASTTMKEAYGALSGALSAKFASSPPGTTDFTKDKSPKGTIVSEALEILIGETNRIESKTVYTELNYGEFAICVLGKKLVIVGSTDYFTSLAIEYFTENYINNSDGNNLSVPGDLSIVVKPYENYTPTPKPEVMFETVTPIGETLKLNAQVWLANEIEFTSTKEYENPVYTVDMDVIFRNKSTGTILKIPAFWDGGTNWKVRFALTEIGEWEYYTICTDTENTGLHHHAGTVNCTAYTGDLDIYKHGFVKTVPGQNYFIYADGTPFFYLGDTHWTLALEEIDSYGSVETQGKAGITKEIADQYGITSQFKYIMDYRVEQGYTVIQSQPLTWWTGIDQILFDDETGWHNIFETGVNADMVGKFQLYDQYFNYIAEVGMVHSNTQFSYPTSLMNVYFAEKITDEQLEKLCRYWVARYSAYPVMWATTQEGDNDYYGTDRGDCAATPETNPWLLVIDFIDKYDAYEHPSTCHQESAYYTVVEKSNFGKKESHSWYAAQYNNKSSNGNNMDFDMAREYYNNPGAKPVVNYEGRYDHFWTGTKGSRVQGWLAYMNGQVGYGYGVQPIWSIFWASNGITNFTSSDENGEFQMDDNWVEGLYADAGRQVTYIKQLFTQYEWWKLVPCFDGSYYYTPNGRNYSVSTIQNELYIGYFYGTNLNNQRLGTFIGMENANYEIRWLNCQTGEYSETEVVEITDGTYTIPAKPDDGDWVITAKLITP